MEKSSVRGGTNEKVTVVIGRDEKAAEMLKTQKMVHKVGEHQKPEKYQKVKGKFKTEKEEWGRRTKGLTAF